MRPLLVDLGLVSGGAERSFADFATLKKVEAAGVICGPGAADLFESEGPLGGRPWSRSVSGITNLMLDCARLRRQVATAIQATGCSLVYANGIRAGLICSLAVPSGIPLVYHHRDLGGPTLLLRRISEASARWIVASEFVRKSVCGVHKAVAVVPNGFSFASMSAVPAEVPGAGPLVVMVADLVPWKRHDLFAASVALAREKIPQLRALVVGRERDAEQARVVRQGLGEIEVIATAGALPYIAAADVLMSPTDVEPFGRTVIEALHCGTRVVASDVGGAAELGERFAAIETAASEPVAMSAALLAQLARPRVVSDLAEFAIERTAGKVWDIFSDSTRGS
ncbi:MAG TPA: hypothetical protein DCR55_06090 [Lentisphaeria bacterium]|nr:hypothetical protein [Lentisphaeria bacterium]